MQILQVLAVIISQICQMSFNFYLGVGGGTGSFQKLWTWCITAGKTLMKMFKQQANRTSAREWRYANGNRQHRNASQHHCGKDQLKAGKKTDVDKR